MGTAAETEPVNWWTEPEWAQRYLRERDAIPHRREGITVLIDELLPARVTRVLDLGTGDGNTLALVLAVRPEATGVGLDFNPEMLARAEERFADDPRVDLAAHDLDDPLPAGEYDLVVSSFAIHHVVDARKRALYAEVYDRLVPGGAFFNLEHVASPTPELHVEFLHAIGKTPETDDPSNKLTPVETQVQWLREIGFVDADCFWKWRELALFGGTKQA